MPQRVLRALWIFVRRRRRWFVLGAATAVALCAVLLLRDRPPKLLPDALGADVPLNAGERVVIVAPHCDDETLGAGGLLHDAVAARADVHVIMVTNGDGFRYAVEAQFKTLRPTRQNYIKFAYQRQQETLNAVHLLGLSPDRVVFLGYPDRGIAPMWSTNWAPDHPFRSRYTGLTESPYANSFTPGARYCGAQLAADLMALFERYRPTLIVFPHPNDAHPDHWAVNAFVNYVVERASERGDDWARTARLRLYLVHRGEWPNPKGLNTKLALLPPKTLVNTRTRWLVRSLADQTAELKRDAILAYHSQVALMRTYLLSFARQNELFGELDPVVLPVLAEPAVGAGATGRPWSPTALPSGMARITADPVSDTVARRIEASADVIAVDAGRSSSYLYLRIVTRGPMRPDVSYNIHLVPLGSVSSQDRPRVDLRFSPPGNLTVLSGAVQATRGFAAALASEAAVAVPLSELGSPRRLYVNVDTSIAGLGVDRAAWTLVDLGSQPPGQETGRQERAVPPINKR